MSHMSRTWRADPSAVHTRPLPVDRRAEFADLLEALAADVRAGRVAEVGIGRLSGAIGAGDTVRVALTVTEHVAERARVLSSALRRVM